MLGDATAPPTLPPRERRYAYAGAVVVCQGRQVVRAGDFRDIPLGPQGEALHPSAVHPRAPRWLREALDRSRMGRDLRDMAEA